ncbi:MAG: hypothetical protein GY733_07940 [bacterium]|nr:hypothetical protein [bacterium]
MKNRNSISTLLCSVLLAMGLHLFTASTAAAETRMSATYETTIDAPAIEVTSALDMRDDGYNSDYIFGMTRGVADSTVIPAVKPLFFLVTIPLDIVFLPFAAIGGFF